MAVATKVNQTSLFGVPVASSGCGDAVAPAVVPLVVLLQLMLLFTVKAMAFAQSSLAGGGAGVEKVTFTYVLPQLFWT